jgi:hypothetical protein
MVNEFHFGGNTPAGLQHYTAHHYYAGLNHSNTMHGQQKVIYSNNINEKRVISRP